MPDARKKICSTGGSNSRPSDYETDALPTELVKHTKDWSFECGTVSYIAVEVLCRTNSPKGSFLLRFKVCHNDSDSNYKMTENAEIIIKEKFKLNPN